MVVRVHVEGSVSLIVKQRVPLLIAAVLLASLAGTADAQHAQHLSPAQEPAAMDSAMPMSREASGTSWQPNASPVIAVHRTKGDWELMGHGNLFVQYLRDGHPRGGRQAGSINWLMGMARRSVGPGRLGVRAMMSLEALTIPGCGYPDLLASGETCDGEAIIDRQHPHDLFMEAAVTWESPSARGLGMQLYAGPVGEPALGPVAYPHRLSALANPIAPISHHWLDATHVTFGVVTVGLHGTRWKGEWSVFNGREPDENRYDLDMGPLDSYAGRFWFLPGERLALQVSAGHLKDAELRHPLADADGAEIPGHVDHADSPGPAVGGGARVTVDRFTASATYHRPVASGSGVWATTVAWGRNKEDGASTNFVLGETSLHLGDGHALFGRAEVGQKKAHDLGLDEVEGASVVGKLQAGYVRYLRVGDSFVAGLGGMVTASVVPSGALENMYGGQITPGAGVFLTIGPTAVPAAGAPHAGHSH